MQKEYIVKAQKFSKLLIIVCFVVLICGCNKVSNEVFKKNNEILSKSDELKQYKDYNFFEKDSIEKIDKITKSIEKLEGKEKDIIKELDKKHKELIKIESIINEKAKEVITEKYIRQSEQMTTNYEFDKVKLKNLDNKSIKDLNKVIEFMKKNKTDIIDKNKCTMFNKENNGTCSTLKSSVELYDQLVLYEKNYSLILKKAKEEKEKEKSVSKDNTTNNTKNSGSSNRDYNTTKKKSNSSKSNSKNNNSKKTSKGISCSSAYSQRDKLLNQGKGVKVVELGGGRCELIVY